MAQRDRVIRLLSAGAPKAGILACTEAYSTRSGCRFEIVFATSPEIAKRIPTDARDFDSVVTPSAAFAAGPVADAIVKSSVVPLGSIATGVAIRQNADAPDLSTREALCAALVAADRIIYNRASSGAYIETMIETLGLSLILADRTVRTDTGQAAMEHLVNNRTARALAFGQVTEIKRLEALGLRLAGRLPGALAKVTEYRIALTRAGATHEPVRGFLDYLQSDEARTILGRAGLD